MCEHIFMTSILAVGMFPDISLETDNHMCHFGSPNANLENSSTTCT